MSSGTCTARSTKPGHGASPLFDSSQDGWYNVGVRQDCWRDLFCFAQWMPQEAEHTGFLGETKAATIRPQGRESSRSVDSQKATALSANRGWATMKVFPGLRPSGGAPEPVAGEEEGVPIANHVRPGHGAAQVPGSCRWQLHTCIEGPLRNEGSTHAQAIYVLGHSLFSCER
jgi:hypothetical protein